MHDIEVVPIADVKRYENNTKLRSKDEVAKIAASINSYGWDQPIVVDSEMVIIKGHGRLDAAEHLGLEEVPVLISPISSEEAMALRIIDNKSAESGWDADLLWSELLGIKEGGLEFAYILHSLTGYLPEIRLIYLTTDTCRGGGIGRRKRLKIW